MEALLMDPLVILSPHLDDAVLSCGQLLADRPECVVVTVFAGGPYRAEHTVSTYDTTCGFRNAQQAIDARRREDLEALELFHMEHRAVHLGYVDHGYGDRARMNYGEAVADVVRLVGDLGTVPQIVGPLGLAHPDHHATAAVYLGVLAELGHLEAYAYEDLPSRVLYPDEIGERQRWWHLMGWTLSAAHGVLGLGSLDVKQRSVDAYRSQHVALGPHGLAAVRCPERMWRMWPVTA